VLASASAALQFVSRDSSKPGRARQDGHECWVLVSTEAFAQQQLVEAPLQLGGAYNPQSEQFLHGVARRMLAAFADVVRSLAADAAAGDQRVPNHLPCTKRVRVRVTVRVRVRARASTAAVRLGSTVSARVTC
jgi:hypothetical protein